MLNVCIICVGKLKEKFYVEAAGEYIKRLGAFCDVKIIELSEIRKPKNPSPAETETALMKEAENIKAAIPKGAFTIALCIEGNEYDSAGFADLIASAASSGGGRICFIIGSSDGLHPSVKIAAAEKLSMSPMTFPHHLARIMLLEQIYRGFSINAGGKYHK